MIHPFLSSNNYILRCVEVILNSCLFYLTLQKHQFLTILTQE